MPDDLSDGAGFDLLFVCTGNICRSPVAELFTTGELRRRLATGADRFHVHSAGTYGLTGWAIEPLAARSLAGYGVPTATFRARRLGRELITDADLVLTATRAHRAEVVTLAPVAASRTFTLREFARLVERIDPDALPDSDPVDRARSLLATAVAVRGTVAISDPADDDVADPYGEDLPAYERSTADIIAALRSFLNLLTPDPRA